MRSTAGTILTLITLGLVVACGPRTGDQASTTPAPETTLDTALVISMAQLGKNEDGSIKTLPAALGFLSRTADGWDYRELHDADSDAFHKAMAYVDPAGESGLLTAGARKAMIKLWRPDAPPEVIWEADFGGKSSRMRDIEVGDLFGDGRQSIAVATHDQGVVAALQPTADGWKVHELDRRPGIFVHEVEIGDLDGDGVLEVYATPSTPNKFDGNPQPGWVTRYVPSTGEGPTNMVDLGNEHAKEILVADVDQNGRDELYVSVEAVTGGNVRILRIEDGTDPANPPVIATLDDPLCRFLSVGDVDGDGHLEMVAAAIKSGLWLLEPGSDPNQPWTVTSIDRNSGGFEHASILTDLDGDGTAELYVANDKDAEINRYIWVDGKPVRENLYTHPAGFKGFTWNIMPVPVALLPPPSAD
jgi:hypothetical protein